MVSAVDCILWVVSEKHSEHYFVAAHDYDLHDVLWEVNGLFYIFYLPSWRAIQLMSKEAEGENNLCYLNASAIQSKGYI